MADFKFTQTGAQIQNILNKADNIHLYKHTVALSKGYPVSYSLVFYTTDPTPITTITLLNQAKNNCISMFYKNLGTQYPILCARFDPEASIYPAVIKFWHINQSTDGISVQDCSDSTNYYLDNFPDTVEQIY